MKIAEKPVLLYIIERLLQVIDKEHVILATSYECTDDPIAEFCFNNEIKCYRGPLSNVAERFYQAAKSQNWDFAARINGDNIFLDTEVLASMLKIAAEGQHDFISNVKDRTFPKGMSIEIVRMEYYSKILPIINASLHYQEHVTLYLYDNDNNASHFYFYNTSLPEASGIQLALDTREDFERSANIISQFVRDQWKYNLTEIFNIWKKLNYE